MSAAPQAPASSRDRILVGLAVVSVVAALAMVLGAVLRRGVVAPSDAYEVVPSPARGAPVAALERGGTRAAPPSDPGADLSGDLGSGRAQPWVPAELPAEDVAGAAAANGAGATAALKKCCDALHAGSKRALGQASDACDRVYATLSSRSGQVSDTLASAALGAVRETISRQPKAPSLPAACR